MSDPELTRLVADEFSRRLPDPPLAQIAKDLLPVEQLKAVRDKTVAHHEAVNPNSLSPLTYSQIDELLAFARRFIGVAGAYISIAYEDDQGDYMLSSDAGRAVRCLTRMLRTFGVVQKSATDC